MRLWIDDERPMPPEFTHHAISSKQAIQMLDDLRDDVELVSFDHDLGWEDRDGELVDDTTRRVVTWLIENEVWPAEVRIHTANPVGHDWLIGTITRYFPSTTKIDPRNSNTPSQIRGFENHG
jgi:hypothetical protein